LLAARASLRRPLSRVSAAGDQLAVCCADPVLRRVEVYFKGFEAAFLREALQAGDQISRQVRLRP
jgi:hypothetical protein